MKTPKMYLDTSVISHLKQEDVPELPAQLPPEKIRDTIKFWDAIKAGEYEVAIYTPTILIAGA